MVAPPRPMFLRVLSPSQKILGTSKSVLLFFGTKRRSLLDSNCSRMGLILEKTVTPAENMAKTPRKPIKPIKVAKNLEENQKNPKTII